MISSPYIFHSLQNQRQVQLYLLYLYIHRFLGTGPNVTVVDTPGFKDTEDAQFVDELMNVLGDEVIIVETDSNDKNRNKAC